MLSGHVCKGGWVLVMWWGGQGRGRECVEGARKHSRVGAAAAAAVARQ